LRMSKKSCIFAAILCARVYSACKLDRKKKGIMKELLIVLGLIGAAVLLLSVGVILRKDHSFRSQHIHQNKRMKADRIRCAKTMDKEEQLKSEKKINIDKL